MPRRPPKQRPRSTNRQRSPSRTVAGAHDASPAADPATASDHASHGSPADADSNPSHTSILEVLRRPLDSAQYLSIHYSERLAENAIVASVGSKGDSFDNAMAESFNGLYKWELIYRQG